MRAGLVAARCPACGWQTPTVRVRQEDGPNAEWFAFSACAFDYRRHFDLTHRPAPLRVHIEEKADA